MFTMALYNIVDATFIGRVVGPLGIAGLTIVFPTQMIIMSLGQMVGIGGASIVSRALGARDMEWAERTLGNVIFSACLIGVIATAVVLPQSGFWLKLLGSTDTILPYAREYLNIVMIGAVFQTYAVAVNTLIRAEGNARVAMQTMLIGALTNIGLDALLILRFDMGIRGAAIATVIAQASTAIYVTSYYLSGKSSVRIGLKNLALKAGIMREVLALGVASFVRIASTSFIAVFMNRTLGSLGGDLYVATLGIITRVWMFILMPIIAVGQGLQPILGFSYGAKRPDRSLQVINLSIKVATVMAVTGFLVVFFRAEVIAGIFTSDPMLIATAAPAMTTIFLAWPLVGFQGIGSIVFQAIGKARQAFVTAIARQVIFFLPLVIILPRFYQIDGIWLSFPISDGLAFGFTLALFIPQMREFRKQQALMREAER
jgi:putative MATE family efflux protein